ncbi:MAG: hypothetical protein IH987_00425 [Planctomycetes bacterium]|nr:hypothetical protein [Planctomycetota bacterium]
MQRTAFIITCALASFSAGCAGIYGGGGTDPAPQEGLRNLNAVDFNDDIPQDSDPATVILDGGTVTFAGGAAGTLGIIPLYFSDSFAWDFAAGGMSTVTFDGLDVRVVRFYFAHQGAGAATLTAESADGTSLGTATSFAATSLGDSDAVFEIDAGDVSIARLVIAVPDGAVVALDHLVISVPDESGE